MLSFFKKTPEEPAVAKKPALTPEYDRYFAAKGVRVTLDWPRTQGALCYAYAEYDLRDGKHSASESVFNWVDLFDFLDGIVNQVHIDRIGIAENERREFLAKHDLNSILDSYAVLKTAETAQEDCKAWLLAKYSSVLQAI